MANYTPMIQQYLSIKAVYQDAFLFFRLGDFYEMFFEDAEKASKILEITLTGRDGGENRKIPMCGVPYHSADSYITKLVEGGYKVAICEQVEDPRQAKGVVKREVVRIITPGTVMEGKLIEGKNNNYIASVSFDNESFGISLSDISTGEFYATEIRGKIEEVLIELNQYNPSEILLSEEIISTYKSELQQVESTITKINHVSDAFDIVKFQFAELNMNEISKTIIYSVGQLLFYLQKTQQKKLAHFNKISIYDTKQFMILDQFSKRNLELSQTSREQTKKGSLLWLLDKTETAMGSRLLKRWLEKPLLSISSIEYRLDIVEELFNDPILVDDLRNQLKDVYDIERMISRVSFGNASPRDLYNLRVSLEKVPRIYKIISESEGVSIKKLIDDIDMCEDITSLIENSIVNDPPISPKAGGFIKSGTDEQLDKYYLASSEGKEWLRNLERREKELTGIKSLKVGFNKVFGYFIEVTKSNLSQVPHDRYIRKQTLANAERYITEELKDKEAIILEAEEKMVDLEYQVFSQIREHISSQNARLQKVALQLAKIDVLMSFAIVSSKYGYIKPILNTEGKIIINSSRHPVIEAVSKEKPFIPNDIYLDQDRNQIQIITGPNMAGKSTYMRQIALSVIMAQIGCFVPAQKANLSIIDRIFTRIGAGDDLTSGQSTFMVEMLETNNAITNATHNSLILLDEIGRGTSTYDGMALAQAIIQYIHEHVNAKTLFSTHYHEITGLADYFERIHNIHVNVIEKDGKVIFLHKIEEGKADKSYGIHVAELAGMPTEVIENAETILKTLEGKASEQKQDGQLQLDLFKNHPKENKVEYENEDMKEYKKVINRIKSLDLINMTPMEGFQILFEIQKKLGK